VTTRSGVANGNQIIITMLHYRLRNVVSQYCILHKYADLVVSWCSSNGLVVGRSERLVQREAVDGAEGVWSISRTEDLLWVTSPFWVVDAIDPVLDFHDKTVVLADSAWATAVEETLGVLDGKGAC